MRLLTLLCVFIVSCSHVQQPNPFVPYKTFYSQPPGEINNWPQPIQLECIDNSNIYVYTNGAWWYSGSKGWVPTGGGWYPTPRQIWPNKAYITKQKIAPYRYYGDFGFYF